MLGYGLLPVIALTWRSTRNWRKMLANGAIFAFVAAVTVLPYVIQLYPFNQKIGLYKDIRYERIASVMLRVPDSVWVEVDRLPPGTVTAFDSAVGIRTIPGAVGKIAYTIRKYFALVMLLNRSQMGQVFGAFVFLFVGLSLVPNRDDARRQPPALRRVRLVAGSG